MSYYPTLPAFDDSCPGGLAFNDDQARILRWVLREEQRSVTFALCADSADALCALYGTPGYCRV